MIADDLDFARLVWAQIWQVTAVILVVALITKVVCRHRPHLAYLLWMLVIIKAVTPPIWSSPTGVFSWADRQTVPSNDEKSVPPRDLAFTDLEQNAPHPAQINSSVTDADAAPHPTRIRQTERSTGSVVTTSPHPESETNRRWDRIWHVLLAIWSLGFIISFSYILVRRWASGVMIRRESRSANSALVDFAEDLARRLGIRRKVRLRLIDRPFGPAVFGLFSPTIVLPASMSASNTRGQLEPILAHELIHFRRGDTRWVLLQFLTNCLWWFHPMMWWVRRQVSIERERCCDEEVIAGLNCQPAAYAQTLIDVLKQNRQWQPVFGLAGLRAVDVTQSRLEHIMNNSDRFHRRTPSAHWLAATVIAIVLLPGSGLILSDDAAQSPENENAPASNRPNSATTNWAQFGGSSQRNPVARGKAVPKDWDPETGKGIDWTAKLGTLTWATPAVASGKVFIGTNNGGGYSERYPWNDQQKVDLGCLLCFDKESGQFLWQHSNEKLATGRIHDWPMFGVWSTPCVIGDRLWYINNRAEIVCLDVEGFHDGENDGPFKSEPVTDSREADVIWKYDLIGQLGVSPHNWSRCSVTMADDVLLAVTGNGVEESHTKMAKPNAPAFVALDADTGGLLWTDNSPGANVLHGQWSSPAFAKIDGVPQAIFAGGDGWLYSFDFREIRRGRSKLLWWFDCNPKNAKWTIGGPGRRNNIVSTPVIHGERVYIATGQDFEHGEGVADLWCIDATGRGDLSAELVFNSRDPKTPIPHKKLQACDPEQGDFTRSNPNSGVVWQYDRFDLDADGSISFEETFHRTYGGLAIHKNLLVATDTTGIVHCLDVTNGKPLWTYDLLATCLGAPLIVNDEVIVADEDGDVTFLRLDRRPKMLAEIRTGNCIYNAPVFADDVLYIVPNNKLLAIEAE